MLAVLVAEDGPGMASEEGPGCSDVDCSSPTVRVMFYFSAPTAGLLGCFSSVTEGVLGRSSVTEEVLDRLSATDVSINDDSWTTALVPAMLCISVNHLKPIGQSSSELTPAPLCLSASTNSL